MPPKRSTVPAPGGVRLDAAEQRQLQELRAYVERCVEGKDFEVVRVPGVLAHMFVRSRVRLARALVGLGSFVGPGGRRVRARRVTGYSTSVLVLASDD
jgi:hypothetical protein